MSAEAEAEAEEEEGRRENGVRCGVRMLLSEKVDTREGVLIRVWGREEEEND